MQKFSKSQAGDVLADHDSTKGVCSTGWQAGGTLIYGQMADHRIDAPVSFASVIKLIYCVLACLCQVAMCLYTDYR